MKPFVPTTVEEYVALEIARGVGEIERLERYVKAMSKWRLTTLLDSYRASGGRSSVVTANAFWSEVERRKL